VKGEVILERTWNDPAWGKSLFFVGELNLNFFRFLRENKTQYFWLFLFFVPIMFFYLYIKQKKQFSEFISPFMVVLLGALLLSFLRLLHTAMETYYDYKSRKYLEVMEQGFYFWDLGFINSSHPFFAFNDITSVHAVFSQGSCKLSLRFGTNKDPVD
jgi:hypothetical protein